jgi:hypothetical protein
MAGQLGYLVLSSVTMNENLFHVMLANVHNLLVRQRGIWVGWGGWGGGRWTERRGTRPWGLECRGGGPVNSLRGACRVVVGLLQLGLDQKTITFRIRKPSLSEKIYSSRLTSTTGGGEAR